MAWHSAPSVAAALAEANRRWPDRSKASDGTIGDAAHAARKSDHNPDAQGVVHAFDLTHDPTHGVDCETLSAHLVDRRDTRVKYVIWNKQICESPGWTWKAYTGSNPHTKHMHVSIHSTKAAEDDKSDWWNVGVAEEVVPIIEYIVTEMKKNANGSDVQRMKELNRRSMQECAVDFRKLRRWQLLGAGTAAVGCAVESVSSKLHALSTWVWLVRQGGPWDHKPYIRRTFNPRVPGGEQVWHFHGGHLYFYDIWSNLHYGYVGSAAGFTRAELLDGAGLEQIGSDLFRGQLPKASTGVMGLRKYDNPSDRASIEIGIKLYRAASIVVTSQMVLKEVESSPLLEKKPYAETAGSK